MSRQIEESLEQHLASGQISTEPEYLAWKKREVLAAIEESKDRSNMIPAHEIWKEFGLEH